MRTGIEKVDFTASTKYVCSKMQDLSLRLSFIPEEFQAISQSHYSKNENSELDIYGRTNPMKGIISRKSETLLIYEKRVIK